MSFIRIIHQNFIYLTDFGLTIMPSEDKRGNIYSTPDGAFGGLIVDRESMPAFLLNDVCCLPVLPLRGDQPVDSFLMSVFLVLDEGFVEARQQDMVVVVQMRLRNDQQTVVFPRVAANHGGGEKISQTVGSQYLMIE